MTIGMLYRSEKARTTIELVEEAAKYYHNKYFVRPNMAFVNINEMPAELINGIRIVGTKNVQPGHVWIGVEATA